MPGHVEDFFSQSKVVWIQFCLVYYLLKALTLHDLVFASEAKAMNGTL